MVIHKLTSKAKSVIICTQVANNIFCSQPETQKLTRNVVNQNNTTYASFATSSIAFSIVIL